MLNDEVSSQKGRVRDILSAAKKLMRESSGDNLAEVRDKADELKDVANSVSSLCSERLAALEQALPLAEHFFETHMDLSQWLDDIEAEAELMGSPGLNASQIKKQQDKNKVKLISTVFEVMKNHSPETEFVHCHIVLLCNYLQIVSMNECSILHIMALLADRCW